MYTVKQVSEIMGISIHTLRYYDKEGLFPGLTKRNKRRLFAVKDLHILYIVQCLRDTEMPIAEVREYVRLCYDGEETLDARLAMIRKQEEKVRQDLEFLKKSLKTLKMKEEYYMARVEGKDARKYLPNIEKKIREAGLAV